MTIAGEEIKDFLKMSGHVGKKNVNMYHEAKGIQPAASGLSPQCVMCDRPVSQPAVDWPTPGLVHNTSSLIALVSLQGASAYTTSGRWRAFTLVSGSIPDVSIVILLFIYSCQVLQPGGGFGIFSPLAPGICWGLLLYTKPTNRGVVAWPERQMKESNRRRPCT